MIKSNIEIWRDIPGYEGKYQVSNLGRVMSLTRYVKSKKGQKDYKKPGRILKCFSTNNYLRVELNKNGKGKKFFVHRLVAIAFIPNVSNKPNIDHIDTNTKNNAVCNLKWCTQKENIHNPISYKRNREALRTEEANLKRVKSMTSTRIYKKLGENHFAIKVKCITTGEKFDCITIAERKYNAHCITECCKGKYKYSGKLKDGTKLKWEYIK